jgi:hypothetical protein
MSYSQETESTFIRVVHGLPEEFKETVTEDEWKILKHRTFTMWETNENKSPSLTRYDRLVQQGYDTDKWIKN